MKTFVILYGQNLPGRLNNNYEIYDVTTIINCDDIEDSMRTYVIDAFKKRGKSEKNLDENLYCRRRTLYLHDSTILADRIKVFDHEATNEFYAFVPIGVFVKFDKSTSM